jgi:hypothetical protein
MSRALSDILIFVYLFCFLYLSFYLFYHCTFGNFRRVWYVNVNSYGHH